MGGNPRQSIAAVAALDDPQRSRLYDVIRAAREPMTRESAARAVDISRKLAAFHLDKLVTAGLLEVVTEPVPGRRAVGRAPKRYRPVPGRVEVSIPARSYEELAAMLVDAIAQASSGTAPDEATGQVAGARGRERAAAVDRGDRRGRLGPERALALVESVLDKDGFEPYRSAGCALRLSNCPYSPLAQRAPELVCGLNLSYVRGLLDGLQVDSLAATLAPAPRECCVEVAPTR